MLPRSTQRQYRPPADDLAFYEPSRADTAASGRISDQHYSAGPSSMAQDYTPHFDAFTTSHVETDEVVLDEVPLLEELGIDMQGIWRITRQTVMAWRIDRHTLHEADLGGPLLFCLLLGFLLMLSGKVHFGYIYGFAIIGCFGIYTLLNLMSETNLDMERVCSILGYALLPIVLLALWSLFLDLHRGFGATLTLASVVWSTFIATRFMECSFAMRSQRYLLAYPIALLYASFALITVF